MRKGVKKIEIIFFTFMMSETEQEMNDDITFGKGWFKERRKYYDDDDSDSEEEEKEICEMNMKLVKKQQTETEEILHKKHRIERIYHNFIWIKFIFLTALSAIYVVLLIIIIVT